MSIETQQLGAIYSEITEHFANDDRIQVVPVSGDPPDHYEITYRIPGAVKDENGTIHIATEHSVSISIPFGFPHFPPSCKPQSAIFHPDFDAAAICLGDFWQHDRSLPELISYIGRMISGEHYSKENAFNEEAATWYQDHDAELPFTAPPTDDTADQDISTSAEDISEILELDTLEDTDFEDDFDFPEDTSAIPPEIPPSPDASKEVSPTIDIEQLRLLSSQKNYYQLQEELDGLSSDISIEGRDILVEECTAAFTEANLRYAEADKFENQGAAPKALAAFLAVEQIVADFPNIRAAIRRCEQSVDMLGEISQATGDDVLALSDEVDEASGLPPKDKVARPPKKNKRTKPDKTSKNDKQLTFFNEKSKKSLNIIPYVVAVGVVCLSGTLGFFYYSVNSDFGRSENYLSECLNNIEAKAFQAAEKSCLAAIDTAKEVVFIKQAATTDITRKSQQILQSEELKQGLLGNVLYQGKYISQKSKNAYQAYHEAVEQGDKLLTDELWEEAISSFRQALTIADANGSNLAVSKIEVEEKITFATFASALALIEKDIEKQNWETAVTGLTELQGQLDKLSAEQQNEYQEHVEQLLGKSRFAGIRQQADILFAQSDWTEASKLFQEAIEIGRDLSETGTQEISGLQENVARAELYSTINEANEAFSSGKWSQAINKYTLAKTLLAKNSGILSLQDLERSRHRLDRIILQSTIIRDRQRADAEVDSGNRDKAIVILQKLIDSIQDGQFAGDSEFYEIRTETEKALEQLKDQQFIDSKIQHLTANYEELFIENYPAAQANSLSSPIVTFEKKIDQLLLFKIKCTETSHGRRLTLVMFYSYNPETDSWKFYSET